jgi:hypothetical protein
MVDFKDDLLFMSVFQFILKGRSAFYHFPLIGVNLTAPRLREELVIGGRGGRGIAITKFSLRNFRNSALHPRRVYDIVSA